LRDDAELGRSVPDAIPELASEMVLLERAGLREAPRAELLLGALRRSITQARLQVLLRVKSIRDGQSSSPAPACSSS
jgi:hypothetical protein